MGHDANIKAERKENGGIRTKNALERIEELEKNLGMIANFINENMQATRTRLGTLEVLSEAMATSIGVEQIKTIADDIRKKRILEEVEGKKAALAKGIEDKTIEATEGIETLETIITGIEKDDKGTVLFPEYVQLTLADVADPEHQKELLNAKVGYALKTKNGGTFEVTGAYKFLPNGKIDPVEQSATTV